MSRTATTHYARTAEIARYGGACGTISSTVSTVVDEVTCKRCLKTIETGSAATGYLAGSKLNEALR